MSDEISLLNPEHTVSDETAAALLQVREGDRAAAQRGHDIATLSRPTREERRAIASLRGFEQRHSAAREIGTAYAGRLADVLTPIDEVSRLGLYDLDLSPLPPASTDPSFWWARSDARQPSFYRSQFLADGLHFTGRFTYDDGDLFGFSFGAVAAFEIQHERLPPSLLGRWRSAPSVELFGALLGWTGPYDLFDGDSWCKVWLIRRQTVFQWGFGPNGPVPLVRGERVEATQLINEENAHRSYRHRLNGFHPMPVVEFGGLTPQSIWSHLEVRFDVQLEGNSFLWLDPEVLLRTFQWPAVPAA